MEEVEVIECEIQFCDFCGYINEDEAMHWRLLLADLVEETLDMQYFIWKGDASGELLLRHVILAAGVAR